MSIPSLSEIQTSASGVPEVNPRSQSEPIHDPATHQPPPEGLPACAADHSARHILNLRGLDSGGGHFVECRCRATRKHADTDTAIAEWTRINRPARSVREVAPEQANNVFQMPLRLAANAAENVA